MPAPYLLLADLLPRVDAPYRSGFHRLLVEHSERFQSARGSSHNHQAWDGGYIDHVQEVMNAAVVLYEALGRLRSLPFSLSDALVVLFVHDLEKPWAYEEIKEGWRRREEFASKEYAHQFRLDLLKSVSVSLPVELERAVYFAEGELGHYSNRTRGMSPLAAFCHMCDVGSARLWHDHPKVRDDPWVGAVRSRADQ